MMYLQGMTREPTYTAATQQLMYELQPFPDNGTLPTRFSYPTIAMTLLTHPMALRTTPSTSAQSAAINVTRSTYAPHQLNPPPHQDPEHHSDRSRSTSAERRRRPDGTGRTTQRPPPKQLDIQCKACATHGHAMKECKFFPRVAACLEYMTVNPDDTKETLNRYKKMMHPDAKKAAKDSYLKVLKSSCLPDNTDLDDLADQLTNASSWNDGSDDYSVSICHFGHTTHQHQLVSSTDDQESTTPSHPQPQETLSHAIQPVQYPDNHMMRMIPSGRDSIVTRAIPTIPQLTRSGPPTNPHRLHQVHGHCARVDTRRDLADTGASVSATGRLEILHHFTPHTPYEILGYDGTVKRAAGQGIAYVQALDQDRLEEMFFVYIPTVDGTIISLEHHTRTHPDIHKWTQEAIPSSDTGWVTFRDVDDEVVSRYRTKQEKGLYYIQDLDFYPVPPSTIANMTHDDDADTYYHTAPTVKCRTPRTKSLNCVDFEEDLGQAMIRTHWYRLCTWQTLAHNL